MPPQNNGQMPPIPPAPNFSVDSLQKNQKFMATIKTFAIYGSILWVINAAVGMIVSFLHFSEYYNPFNIIGLVFALIAGAIGFAVGAVIFYFIYDPVRMWVKRSAFLSKHIHDMFTLFWKPYLVCFIIGAVFGLLGMLSLGATLGAYGVVSFGGLFVGWLITSVINVGVYYWYAKTMSAKLTPFYPW